MHQLKVLILGPASFTATLNELEPFLKFNSVKEKNSSDFDVILFHEEALKDEKNKKIINNTNSLKVCASNNKYLHQKLQVNFAHPLSYLQYLYKFHT